MKTIFFLIGISVSLISCQPEDPTPYSRKATGYIYVGSTNMLVAPGGVRCPTAGNNCWLFLEPGDYPIYSRQSLNDFYSDYFANDITHYFQNYNWRQVFPTGAPINDTEVQKIINGQYGVKVLSDSSIVVLKNPSLGITDDNILFALDRNDLPD